MVNGGIGYFFGLRPLYFFGLRPLCPLPPKKALTASLFAELSPLVSRPASG